MIGIKRKISFIFAMTLMLIFVSFLNTDAAESIVVCDPARNTLYTVTFDSDYVHISSDSCNVSFENTNNLYTCGVYNGVFSFLGYNHIVSSGSEQTVIYRYNVKSGDTEYEAINVKASLSPYNFAVSETGNCYFASGNNSRILYTLSGNGSLEATTLTGSISQILCSKSSVNVITSDGLFVVNGTDAVRASDTPPEIPLIYTDSGNLKDSVGCEYYFYEDVLTPKESDPPAPVVPQITFEDNYCVIPQGITFAKLRDLLGGDKDNFFVYDANSKKVTSGQLGTGMQVSFRSQSYTLIIYGELTFEGNINSRDLKLMMKFITGEITPSDLQFKAADINCDGNITVKDLLLLSKMY